MSASITMETIARKLGVSIMTVSWVINGPPHVKAETKEKVLGSAARLGYIPNFHAQGLARNQSFAIAFLGHPFPGNRFFTIVQSMEAALVQTDYQLILSGPIPKGDAAVKALRIFAGMRPAGIIYDVEMAQMSEAVIEALRTMTIVV